MVPLTRAPLTFGHGSSRGVWSAIRQRQHQAHARKRRRSNGAEPIPGSMISPAALLDG